MSNIKLFQSKQIRSVWNKEEQQWCFSVVDIVGALTDSTNPTDYLKKMRKRDLELAFYIGTNCPQVNMLTDTGKNRRTLAANTKGILRIIQSIPSPKAEPFKLWLAQVGSDRIAEIENPELAQKRIRDTYRAKSYSDETTKSSLLKGCFLFYRNRLFIWQIIVYPYPFTLVRSCTASARWAAVIISLPSRSAIVRATLMIRSWLRALSPSAVKNLASSFSAAASIWQCLFSWRRPICALQYRSVPCSRCNWR